ncbi:hypothetical protein OK016_21020 [Vibrio chagasii]|nr:hypothetical protein [Vibrio chagasii]
MSTKLKLLGVDVASIGEVHGKTEGAQSLPTTMKLNKFISA